MQKYIFSLILFLSSFSSFAADELTQYSKIQLRPIPATDDSGSRHLGVILTFKNSIRLGVYGAKKNNPKFSIEKYSYELLGEVDLSSFSVGATINVLTVENDTHFTLNRVNGSRLDDICGDYYGLKGGLTLWLGGSGFTAINGEGIILRSSVTSGGAFRFDGSVIDVTVRCIDANNPNWAKVMRFQ